jgi:hypothetical protein
VQTLFDTLLHRGFSVSLSAYKFLRRYKFRRPELNLAGPSLPPETSLHRTLLKLNPVLLAKAIARSVSSMLRAGHPFSKAMLEHALGFALTQAGLDSIPQGSASKVVHQKGTPKADIVLLLDGMVYVFALKVVGSSVQVHLPWLEGSNRLHSLLHSTLRATANRLFDVYPFAHYCVVIPVVVDRCYVHVGMQVAMKLAHNSRHRPLPNAAAFDAASLGARKTFSALGEDGKRVRPAFSESVALLGLARIFSAPLPLTCPLTYALTDPADPLPGDPNSDAVHSWHPGVQKPPKLPLLALSALEMCFAHSVPCSPYTLRSASPTHLVQFSFFESRS